MVGCRGSHGTAKASGGITMTVTLADKVDAKRTEVAKVRSAKADQAASTAGDAPRTKPSTPTTAARTRFSAATADEVERPAATRYAAAAAAAKATSDDDRPD